MISSPQKRGYRKLVEDFVIVVKRKLRQTETEIVCLGSKF